MFPRKRRPLSDPPIRSGRPRGVVPATGSFSLRSTTRHAARTPTEHSNIKEPTLQSLPLHHDLRGAPQGPAKEGTPTETGSSWVLGRPRRRSVTCAHGTRASRDVGRPHGSLLLVLWSLAVVPWAVTAAPFDACYSAIGAADASGDGTIDTTEFQALVGSLSNGLVATTDGSPWTETFANDWAGVNWSAESSASETTASACRTLYQSLLTQLNRAVSAQTCTVGLVVGDANRSNGIAADLEFVRFVNYLSGGRYAGLTDYDALEEPLRTVWDRFADTALGEVNVTGSKPNETPTEEQQLTLQDFCDQTALAVATLEEAGTTTTTAPPTPGTTAETVGTDVPTPSSQGDGATTPPVDSGVVAPSFTFSECTTSMAFSDLTRNGILETNEYVRFLNRLSSNAFVSDTYDTLPVELQENFVELSVDGAGEGISIVGSEPGASPTDEELAHLQNICASTDAALQAVTGTSTDAPVAASTPPSTNAPTPAATGTLIVLELARCKQFLAISDLDRDKALSEIEWLRFLSYASARAITETDFAELDPILQENYQDLAELSDNGMVDITGSQPRDTPTAEQEEHLANVCDSSVEALNKVLNPVEPSTIPPLGNATNTTVYNAWVVSDPSARLTASSLRSGLNRQALDQGYAAFVSDQFDRFLERIGGSRLLQQQAAGISAETVFLVDGSAQNYDLVDYAPCPPFESGQPSTGNCIKVFSSFDISTVNVNNSQLVADQLMQQTMGNIPQDLQPLIEEAYPETPLLVVNGNLPLRPGVPEPDDDDDDEVTESGGKSNGGAIAGSIIVVLLIICGCGGGYYYMKKNNLTCEDIMVWLPDVPGLSKSIRKDEDAEKTADIEKAAFGDDDDDDYAFGAAPASKDNLEIDFKYGDDDESGGFSVMDQDPSQNGDDDPQDGVGKSGKFKFGRGKKKAAAGNFDGAIGDMGVDAFNDNAANDFADYGFDDPVASMDNNDDIFGTKGDSAFESAWGTGGRGGSEAGEQYSKSSRSRRSNDERSESGSDSGSDEDTYDDGGDEEPEFGREQTFGAVDLPENMRHLDAMVDQGNWDGVMAAATKIDNDFTDGDGSERSRPSLQESEGLSQSDGSDNSSTSPKPVLYDRDRSRDDNSAGDSYVSYSSEDLRRRAQYRGQVEALVKKVVPDEIDNIDAMMDQFAGREAELIHTLQTMEERSATQRARKAVHKSKAMPQRESVPFGPGGTEGSAAIAAASTIGVQVGAFDDGGGFAAGDNFGFGSRQTGFDNDYGNGSYQSGSRNSGSYSDDGSHSESRSGSYTRSERSGSRSYYSDEQSGASRSYYSEGQSAVSGSQYSDSRGGSYQSGSYRSGDAGESHVSGEGSRSYVSGEGSRSYYSGEGSRSYRSGEDEGSYVSGEGSRSYRSGEDGGSYVSGEGSRSYVSGEGSRSYVSGEGSRSYVSGEGSRSYISGEEGSYVSGEGSRSYVSGEGSRSYVSGEGSRSYVSGKGSRSYVSGEGSRSYISGEEGSYVSGEGSRSYVSGEGSRSYVSGEGSRSYVSGEGSRSYVSGEGSRSYISGEEEGSYVSGEGSRSYRSGEGEGSYVSGEGSRSYVSGEEEGSYVSGEGSGSYRSGDDEGSYISGEGSRSYVSGEGSYESGSYISGEGSRSRSSYSGE